MYPDGIIAQTKTTVQSRDFRLWLFIPQANHFWQEKYHDNQNRTFFGQLSYQAVISSSIL
jgi:hypothetical protein